MFKENKSLAIIALIAVVNALGYGIVIPILYSYSKRFGLSDFQNGLLFSIFSICSFLATPIIGRMSDKYGRRPLLLISIAGTAISFFMQAFAPGAIFLFLARALDGLTAGNISVASAVISDTTKPQDRAKGFGIIGASFGFGFVFGPAISALTVGISPSLPFIIAGIISLIALLATFFILPETNKNLGQTHSGKFFDFGKLYHSLFDPNVGKTLLVGLITTLAFSCSMMYGFQPFARQVLHLSDSQISTLFVVFGLIGLVSQVLIVPNITKKLGLKKAFSGAIFGVGIGFLAMYFSTTAFVFILASIFLGLANSIVGPLIQTLLSRETDEKSQGSIMGLNSSYQNIGQIFGPILGGLVASIHIPLVFLVGTVLMFLAFALSQKIVISSHKAAAF